MRTPGPSTASGDDAQQTRVRSVRRVANHQQSADIVSPHARVAVSTEVCAASSPKAGTDRGVRTRSPRLVTEETRPRWAASIDPDEGGAEPDRGGPGGEAEQGHRGHQA